VEADLDVLTAEGIEPQVRERLVARIGPMIRVVVDTSRSQDRNRRQALDQIENRLRSALKTHPDRRATRPKRSAVERRLEAKRRRSERKADRGRRRWDDD
jgi:ribosome-associated protein